MQALIDQSLFRLRQASPGPAPRLALVLGSGWDAIADLVTDPIDIP